MCFTCPEMVLAELAISANAPVTGQLVNEQELPQRVLILLLKIKVNLLLSTYSQSISLPFPPRTPHLLIHYYWFVPLKHILQARKGRRGKLLRFLT